MPLNIDVPDTLSIARGLLTRSGNVTVSYLQRQLYLRYAQAAAIMAALEREGFVSAPNERGLRTIVTAASSTTPNP